MDFSARRELTTRPFTSPTKSPTGPHQIWKINNGKTSDVICTTKLSRKATRKSGSDQNEVLCNLELKIKGQK
jgi:hypothetical protein